MDKLTPVEAAILATETVLKYLERMTDPIVVAHNKQISAISFNMHMGMLTGILDIESFKTGCIALFLMGYDAANKETPIPDAFKE